MMRFIPQWLASHAALLSDRWQVGTLRLPAWIVVACGALAYYATAALGLGLASLHDAASPIWPASGLAVAMVFQYGTRMWPAIAAGAFAGNLQVGDPLVAAAIALGNMLEGVVGGVVLRKLMERQTAAAVLPRTLAFTCAALFPTTISATIGVGTLYLAGTLDAAAIIAVWPTWWGGDALGVLAIAPALLALTSPSATGAQMSHRALRFAGLAVAIAATLGAGLLDGDASAFVFLAFPVALVASRWFRARGAAWCALVIGTCLVAETALGFGPFAIQSLNESLINAQLFVGTLCLASLVFVDLQPRRMRVPGLVLVSGCVIAAAVFVFEHHMADRQAGIRFDGLIERANQRIQERMAIYTNALRGGAGLFLSSSFVSRDEWRNFAEILDLSNRYPGTYGIGIITPVRPAEVAAFIAERRADGAPDFTLKTVPGVENARASDEPHFIIQYIEPEASNAAALGLDVASEVGRKLGAVTARDTGQPTLGRRIALVQDAKDRPGFLLYLPMYHVAKVPASVAERRALFRGWVYMPFAAEDLFRAALEPLGSTIDLEVFDGDTVDPAALLVPASAGASADTPPVPGADVAQMSLAAHRFTIRWRPGPGFEAETHHAGTVYGASIVLLATLLAALAATLQSVRAQAAELAATMNVALVSSNERFELVVAGTNDGIWDWDVKNDTIWSSSRCSQMFGYEPAEMPSERTGWRAMLEPDDAAEGRLRVARIEAGETDRLDVVQRYRHKDGHLVFVHNQAQAVRGPDGSIVRMVGALTDITPLIKAEQRLRDAIAAMGNGFAMFDADDRLVIFNDGFVDEGTRRTMPDLIGRTYEEVMRAFAFGEVTAVDALPDREAWLAWRLERHRRMAPEPLEIQWTDGRWMRVVERRTSEGGTVGTWTDVTGLKLAEARLQDAIENINEGFVLLDAEDRCVVVNQHFLDMYPISGRLAVRGTKYEEIMRCAAENGEFPGVETREQIEAHLSHWIAYYATRQPYVGERKLADGRWVLVSHRPTSNGGYVSIRTDITAQKRREAELQAAKDDLELRSSELVALAEDLELARNAANEANRGKSQFLANMSHELRTPLNSINGFSEMMVNEVFGPLQPDNYREYATLIHQSGKHLLSLINDILDLSKVEAGKMEVHVEALPTQQVAYASIEGVRTMATERGVELKSSIAKNCPILHADPRAVKQVMLNLLSNAVKFTSPKGTVTLDISCNDNGVEISVSDTGIGMTADESKRALELYGQVQSDLGKKQTGTGLGLPLVKSLVELHGGRLILNSEKGRGTTAKVNFPWTKGLPAKVG